MARKKFLKDIEYLYIKISKEDKDRIIAYMKTKNFYSLSEFIRVTVLGIIEQSKGV